MKRLFDIVLRFMVSELLKYFNWGVSSSGFGVAGLHPLVP